MRVTAPLGTLGICIRRVVRKNQRKGAWMRSETIAVHGGFDHDSTTKAVAVPIYQTVAYEFDSADHAAALFDLEAEGYRYSRIANPTNAVLEKRVAELEGGVGALSVATGQAALYYALANVADHGGNIVAAPTLYGTTHTLLQHVLPRQGIDARFARSTAPEDMARAIDVNTRALFCESVGNPAGNICDVAALAEIAHARGIPLIVDNTVATPALLRPIEHGADIVVHSLIKFMGGHGATLGGIIVDGGRFRWRDHSERFPMFNQPDDSYHGLVYVDHFGETAYIARARVERHVENTRKVAEFLHDDPRVAWVNYAGFSDNPYFVLAEKYFNGRVPSLLTFGVKGGLEAGKAVYDSLRLVKRLVNIGDAKSLACHPASTTHRQMSPAEQAKAGVSPEMIRLSIGIEHIDDIIEDLDQALAATAHAAPRLAAQGVV
jgi:O-acetylhomoserine (thiol)-lyase